MKLSQTIATMKAYSAVEIIQLFVLLIFVSTLTLDQKTNSAALVALLFFQLFTFRLKNLRSYRTPILIFTGIFAVSVAALCYSANVTEGKLVLERQLSLLLIPLIGFAGFRMDSVKFHIVIKTFFISIVIVSIYLLKISTEEFWESQLAIKDWFVRDHLYHAFAKPIRMHATFLSLYVGLGIFVGFYWFLLKNTWWMKALVFLLTLVLVTTLTLLASRIVISFVLAILFFVYPFFMGQVRYKFIAVLAGAAIGLISFFLVQESSFIKSRFIENIRDEIRLKPFLKADSTYNPEYGGETRADRWFCAVELVKEKPLFGYGTGSEKDVLMQKYEKYNLRNAIVNNYDAHNQYLAYTIKSGFLGLLVFLISIGYALFISVKKGSFIYLSFVLLFAVTCVTENVLESNKGIFFFAFFNFLFCSFCLMKKPDPGREE